MRDDQTVPLSVWLVARAFPPEEAIGAERPKKFVRYFVEKGHPTTVFTVAHGEEENIRFFSGAPVRRSSPMFSQYFGKAERRATSPWRKVRLLIPRIITAALDDSGWTWMASLRRDLEKAWSEGSRPDIILATGRPFLTFLTVSRFARKHRISFVLDYRDAWSRNPHPTYDNWFRRHLLTRLEGRANRQADGIITVSNLTAKALKTNKTPVVIYNLPDQGYMDELKSYTPQVEPISRDKLVLVYTGTLYPGRDLDPICAALAKLDSEARNRIEVHYCGNSATRAEASFKRYGVQEQLISHGNLSKSDATRLLAAGDLALSIICSETATGNDALRGVITTKVFDYLLLEKDVLNTVPEGFEFRMFADEVRLGGLKNYAPEDVDGIADFLQDKLAAKGASGGLMQANSAATMIAAWEAQMTKLDSLLADICRKK